MENILFNTSQCVSLPVRGSVEEESRLSSDTACPCPTLLALSEAHPLCGHKCICSSGSEESQEKGQATQSNPEHPWPRNGCLSSFMLRFIHYAPLSLPKNSHNPLQVLTVIDSWPRHSVTFPHLCVTTERNSGCVKSCPHSVKRVWGLGQTNFFERAFLPRAPHWLLFFKTVQSIWCNLTRTRVSISTVAILANHCLNNPWFRPLTALQAPIMVT